MCVVGVGCQARACGINSSGRFCAAAALLLRQCLCRLQGSCVLSAHCSRGRAVSVSAAAERGFLATYGGGWSSSVLLRVCRLCLSGGTHRPACLCHCLTSPQGAPGSKPSTPQDSHQEPAAAAAAAAHCRQAGRAAALAAVLTPPWSGAPRPRHHPPPTSPTTTTSTPPHHPPTQPSTAMTCKATAAATAGRFCQQQP
jgi:hypothetical protein